LKKEGQYDASGLKEAQFDPGSRRRVLKNLLGVKTRREMDRVEQREQFRALEQLIELYGQDHRFTAADVCNIHRIWLGPIYVWAGQYRQVNLTKGDFPFAAARQVPRLMAGFERGPLRTFTPCRFGTTAKAVRAIAVVHTEPRRERPGCTPFSDADGISGWFAALGFWWASRAKKKGIFCCRAGWTGPKL